MERDLTSPQPDPKPGRDSVTDGLVSDLQTRRDAGKIKYGGELKSGNGRNALVDAYQEAMDMALYLRQRVMEDQDREEARVELEKLKAGLLKIRDQVTPAWFFTDLVRRVNFVLDRL